MPNLENITSPITLVGARRSGSSLVSRILAGHSQCHCVGDTTNLVHDVTKALESSLTEKKQSEIPHLLRHQFLKLFPSSEARWAHQSIGLPMFRGLFADEDQFINWFWDTLEQAFPNAVFLTVLRHPLDTIVSAQRWTGDNMETIVERKRLTARVVSHEKSMVRFALNYHELIADPEAQIERLFDNVALSFEPQCLDALDVAELLSKDNSQHAPDDFASRRASSFSHRDHWSEIPREVLTDDYCEAIEECWKKYRLNFGGWK